MIKTRLSLILPLLRPGNRANKVALRYLLTSLTSEIRMLRDAAPIIK
jgi:hypothetical protein